MPRKQAESKKNMHIWSYLKIQQETFDNNPANICWIKQMI